MLSFITILFVRGLTSLDFILDQSLNHNYRFCDVVWCHCDSCIFCQTVNYENMFFRVSLLKNLFWKCQPWKLSVFFNLSTLAIFFSNPNIKIGFSLSCIKCVMILGFRIKALRINFEYSSTKSFLDDWRCKKKKKNGSKITYPSGSKGGEFGICPRDSGCVAVTRRAEGTMI